MKEKSPRGGPQIELTATQRELGELQRDFGHFDGSVTDRLKDRRKGESEKRMKKRISR